ncbi:hypothetical protein [Sorangium sp. So ce1078]|uniref:hypothetical protein n=1 Tax=Sorangium sp. So ce1078 TaxID=3133329 RepID=UPI003F5EAC36
MDKNILRDTGIRGFMLVSLSAASGGRGAMTGPAPDAVAYHRAVMDIKAVAMLAIRAPEPALAGWDGCADV